MFNLHCLKFIRPLPCDSLSSGKSEAELIGKAEISENSPIIYASGEKKNKSSSKHTKCYILRQLQSSGIDEMQKI